MVIPVAARKKMHMGKVRIRSPNSSRSREGHKVCHPLPSTGTACPAHCGRDGQSESQSSHSETRKASLTLTVSDSCSCGKGNGGINDRVVRDIGRRRAKGTQLDHERQELVRQAWSQTQPEGALQLTHKHREHEGSKAGTLTFLIPRKDLGGNCLERKGLPHGARDLGSFSPLLVTVHFSCRCE